MLKRYVSEPGSGWVRGLCAAGAGHELYVVRITAVEAVSGLVRYVPPLPTTSLAMVLADFKFDFEHQYLRLNHCA